LSWVAQPGLVPMSEITWSVNDPQHASCVAGAFTASQAGTYVITASTTTDIPGTISTLVFPPTIELSLTPATIWPGQSSAPLIRDKTTPAAYGWTYVSPAAVTWSFNPPTGVQIVNGALLASDSGTYTITATSASSVSGTATLVVRAPFLDITPSTASLWSGQQFTPSLRRNDATHAGTPVAATEVTWSVTPPSGGTVTNGVFQAAAAGVCQLTATVPGYLPATTTLTISEPALTLTSDRLVVNPGALITATVTTIDSDSSAGAAHALDPSLITWSSSRTDVQPQSGGMILVNAAAEPGLVTLTASRVGYTSSSLTLRINAAPSLGTIVVTPGAAGQAVSVHAEAQDDDSTVTYAWSLMSPLPAVVSWHRNGSTDAQHTSMAVPAPGAYQIQVTATDPWGLASTATTTVTVAAEIVRLDVSPSTLAITADTTVDLSHLCTITARDQFGQTVINPTVTWTSMEGSLSGSTFRAGTTNGPTTLTAHAGSVSATVVATISDGQESQDDGATTPPAGSVQLAITGGLSGIQRERRDGKDVFFTNNASLTATISVSAPGCGISAYAVSGGGGSAAPGSNPTLSVTFVADGEFDLVASVDLTRGGQTTTVTSEPLHVIVDHTAPTADFFVAHVDDRGASTRDPIRLGLTEQRDWIILNGSNDDKNAELRRRHGLNAFSRSQVKMRASIDDLSGIDVRQSHVQVTGPASATLSLTEHRDADDGDELQITGWNTLGTESQTFNADDLTLSEVSGAYTLTATWADKAGNLTTPTDLSHIWVDTVAPQAHIGWMPTLFADEKRFRVANDEAVQVSPARLIVATADTQVLIQDGASGDECLKLVSTPEGFPSAENAGSLVISAWRLPTPLQLHSHDSGEMPVLVHVRDASGNEADVSLLAKLKPLEPTTSLDVYTPPQPFSKDDLIYAALPPLHEQLFKDTFANVIRVDFGDVAPQALAALEPHLRTNPHFAQFSPANAGTVTDAVAGGGGGGQQKTFRDFTIASAEDIQQLECVVLAPAWRDWYDRPATPSNLADYGSGQRVEWTATVTPPDPLSYLTLSRAEQVATTAQATHITRLDHDGHVTPRVMTIPPSWHQGAVEQVYEVAIPDIEPPKKEWLHYSLSTSSWQYTESKIQDRVRDSRQTIYNDDSGDVTAPNLAAHALYDNEVFEFGYWRYLNDYSKLTGHFGTKASEWLSGTVDVGQEAFGIPRPKSFLAPGQPPHVEWIPLPPCYRDGYYQEFPGTPPSAYTIYSKPRFDLSFNRATHDAGWARLALTKDSPMDQGPIDVTEQNTLTRRYPARTATVDPKTYDPCADYGYPGYPGYGYPGDPGYGPPDPVTLTDGDETLLEKRYIPTPRSPLLRQHTSALLLQSGFRWLNTVKLQNDVITTGRQTIRIQGGFTDKTNSLKKLDEKRESQQFVWFVAGTSDTTVFLVSQRDNPALELPDDKIAILEQRFIVDGPNASTAPILELDVNIGEKVPAALYHVDVNCGAVKAYSDELSSAFIGSHGGHRMEEALAVCTVQVNPIELWQLEDEEYTIRVVGKESVGNQPASDEKVWIDVALPHLKDAEAKDKVKDWTLNWDGMEPHCFYLNQGNGVFVRQGNQSRLAVDDGKVRFLGGMAGETDADQWHDSGLSLYDYTIHLPNVGDIGFDEDIEAQVAVYHRRWIIRHQITPEYRKAPYGATTLFGNSAEVACSDKGPVPVLAPTESDDGGLTGSNERFLVRYDPAFARTATDGAPVSGPGAAMCAPIIGWAAPEADHLFRIAGEAPGDTIIQISPKIAGIDPPPVIAEIACSVEVPMASEMGIYQMIVARRNVDKRQEFANSDGIGPLIQEPTPVPPAEGVNNRDWELPVSPTILPKEVHEHRTTATDSLDGIFEYNLSMLAQIVPTKGLSNLVWHLPFTHADSIGKIAETLGDVTAPAVELSLPQYRTVLNSGLAFTTSEDADQRIKTRLAESGPPLALWRRFLDHVTAVGTTARTDAASIRERQVLEARAKSCLDTALLARLRRYFTVRSDYDLHVVPFDGGVTYEEVPEGKSISALLHQGNDVTIHLETSFWTSLWNGFWHTTPLSGLLTTSVTPNWNVGHPYTEEITHWMIGQRLSWVKALMTRMGTMGMATNGAPNSVFVLADQGALSGVSELSRQPIEYTQVGDRPVFRIPDRNRYTTAGGGQWYLNDLNQYYSNIHITYFGVPGDTSTGPDPRGLRIRIRYIAAGGAQTADLEIRGTNHEASLVVRLLAEVQVLEGLLQDQASASYWQTLRQQQGSLVYFLHCVGDFVFSTTDVYRVFAGRELETGVTLSPEQRLMSAMMVATTVLGGVPGVGAVRQGWTFLRTTAPKDYLRTAARNMAEVASTVRTSVDDMAEGGVDLAQAVTDPRRWDGAVRFGQEAMLQGARQSWDVLNLPLGQLYKAHMGLGRLSQGIAVRTGSQVPHGSAVVGMERSHARIAPHPSALRRAPTPRTADELIGQENLALAQRTLDAAVAAGRNTDQAMKEMEATCGRLECFPAGTPVLMADGLWRSIEALRPGDLVRSRSQYSERSPLSSRAVRSVQTSTVDMLVMVRVLGSDGVPRDIRCTASHPFWLHGHGWTSAEDLPVGGRVAGDLDALPVLAVTSIPGPTLVYTLDVAIDRTYFVASQSERGPPTAVWVHNDCAMRVRLEAQVRANAKDLGYTLSDAQVGVAIKELMTRAANRGQRGLFVKATLDTGTNDSTVNRLINRIELTEGQRTVKWVREAPSKNPLVKRYERGAEGHLFDALTGDSLVPILPYKSELSGRTIADFKKFDGIKRAADGSLTTTLIDRKYISADGRALRGSGFKKNLEKTVSALKDNPGYTCIMQVPTEEAAVRLRKLILEAGGEDLISVEKVSSL